MHVLRVGAAALFVAGLALVALSVAQGGASITLVVIIPVISGSSLTFLGGVVLLLAGFLALLFSYSGGWEEESSSLSPGATPTTTGTGGAGGLVLVGPVPIVFGSWRGVSRRVRGMLALLGAVLLIVVVLAFVGLLR